MDKYQLAKMHSNLWCKECDDLYLDWAMDKKLNEMDKAYNDETEKAERVAALALELGASTQISHFQKRETNHEFPVNGNSAQSNGSEKSVKKRKQNGKDNKQVKKSVLTAEENEFLDQLINTIENQDE